MRNSEPPKLALGVALLLTGIILFFSKQSVNVTSSTTFASEPVKIEGFSAGLIDEKKIPRHIIIPSIGIDLDVAVSNIIDGYWEVFGDKAGWGEGSGLVGEKGNQVIFAHAKQNLFLQLRSIKLQSKIYILADSGWYKYEVIDIKEVSPNQVEVIAPTEEEILTLYTCSGFKDAKRFIVVAKRI